MSDTATTAPQHEEPAPPVELLIEEAVLLEDVLVEDVSIDGMCGVY